MFTCRPICAPLTLPRPTVFVFFAGAISDKFFFASRSFATTCIVWLRYDQVGYETDKIIREQGLVSVAIVLSDIKQLNFRNLPVFWSYSQPLNYLVYCNVELRVFFNSP